MLWHYAPDNLATFKNYGIVANRGVAYCDNRIFLLTLDMTIVALDPATGKQLAPRPDRPCGPRCVRQLRLLGDERPDLRQPHRRPGRGRLRLRRPRLRDGVPHRSHAGLGEPVLDHPAGRHRVAQPARLVGGATNWTPETVDPTTNTLYFGTAAASPAYYPSLRPGSNPRADSVVAVDLATGKLKWWQQQLASNQWGYDTSQPPLVYTAKIGGKSKRIVSIATMEGVWFAYDAATGAPIYQRVKVIDNVEHPALNPGKPVAVYPSSLGGLNYSPASFNPQTNYVYNAASETASALQQQTPAQEQQQQLLLGNTFLGLANGDFGSYLQSGWRDYGSVSAIDVATGQRVWKFNTPEPERGGVTTTASGLGFVGGGDGNLRAFDAKSGTVLWKFQTGRQIAAGPTVYSANGTEYVAITVGGTVTSSNGGTVASQLQVFSLGGSSTQSPAFTIAFQEPTTAPQRVEASAASAVRAAPASRSGAARIVTPGGLTVQPWDPDTSNTTDVQGHLLLAGQPVAGARVSVDGWVAPPTDKSGVFVYPADITVPARHVVSVADADHAKIGGKPLTDAQHAAVLKARGGISVGYAISNLSSRPGAEGTVVVTGRLGNGKGLAPPPVGLYSYQLTGRITDANGAPVKGAVVTTRTNDHKFWTVSEPTGPTGVYTSFLVAADQAGDDPVPMTVGVAVGSDSYAEPLNDFVDFPKLKSATLNIQLPAQVGGALVKSSLNPTAMPGAIYRGPARRRRRRQGPRDQAGERALADRPGQVRARAAGLGSRPGREVLGVRSPVLLDHGGAPGRGRRPGRLPQVASSGRSAGRRDAEAERLSLRCRECRWRRRAPVVGTASRRCWPAPADERHGRCEGEERRRGRRPQRAHARQAGEALSAAAARRGRDGDAREAVAAAGGLPRVSRASRTATAAGRGSGAASRRSTRVTRRAA